MSSEEPRSPTFDGTETAGQTGHLVDVSGSGQHRESQGDQSAEGAEQAEKPTEAAQIVP